MPSTIGQNFTTITNLTTVTTPYTSTSLQVSTVSTYVNSTETYVTTIFTSNTETFRGARCAAYGWILDANSTQIVYAKANATQGVDVYLLHEDDYFSWLGTPCITSPKNPLVTVENVTSFAIHYVVPSDEEPCTAEHLHGSCYVLAFLYLPDAHMNAGLMLIVVSIWLVSSKVQTMSKTIYSTSFQPIIYSTVETRTTSTVIAQQALTVIAQQAFLGQYGLPTVAITILLAVTIAYVFFKRKRKKLNIRVDENLVRQAKTLGINVSRLTEKVLAYSVRTWEYNQLPFNKKTNPPRIILVNSLRNDSDWRVGRNPPSVLGDIHLIGIPAPQAAFTGAYYPFHSVCRHFTLTASLLNASAS